jgi:laminin alpha 3/5
LCSFYLLQAKELEDVFKESNTSSGNAIDAANAYSNIEAAIQEAHVAAQDAGSAAENATDMSEGLDERTGESEARSSELLQNARGTLDQAQRELMPHLEKAKNSVEEVRQMNLKSDEGDNRINRYVHGRESDENIISK